MRIVTPAVAAVATLALAVGGWGMAEATPTSSHHAAGHGLIGEDAALRLERSATGLPRLLGKVNDNRDLTISDRTPAAGRYKIIIRDSTKRHNWHIFGSGVDKETSVRGTGRWAWRVRLRAGTYTVVCDPHAQTMRFTMTVGG